MTALKTTELAVIAANKPSKAAEILNFPVSRVYEARKTYRITRPRRKYYAEDIAAIMERKSGGESWASISRHYGVDRNSLLRSVQRAERKGFDSYPKRPK